MKKTYSFLFIALVFLSFVLVSKAQTDEKFKTTNYISKNREYFVRVTPNKIASLYKGRKKIWTKSIPELPGNMLVTDDGKRVIMIENYYGNNNDRKREVVIIFGEKGDKIAGFELASLADFDNVLHTNSGSKWLDNVELNQSKNELVVNTIVLSCALVENGAKIVDLKMIDKCKKPQPKEKITFSIVDGKLLSRTQVGSAEK